MSQNVPLDSEMSSALPQVRDRLAQYCGVYLDDVRFPMLHATIERAAAQVDQSVSVYIRMLATDAAQLQQLAEQVLNHETTFFRNRAHMEALRTVVIPEWDRLLPAGAPLRIWSAGCATGEEAFSLAITALEALGDPPTRPVRIWATDLSAAALEQARMAVYGGRSIAGIDPDRLQRYFVPHAAGMTPRPHVRAMVEFAQLNLVEPLPEPAYDQHVIFCENVTIYFQVDTCRALMGRFYAALPEGGALFLGFSETLWQIFEHFQWRQVAGTYLYQKARAAEATPGSSDTPPAASPNPVRAGTPEARPVLLLDDAELVRHMQVLLDAGDYDAILDLAARSAPVNIYAPRVTAMVARARANRGELDLAVAEARRALELDPLAADAYVLLGLIYSRQGRPHEAIRQLERARYVQDSSPLIAFYLGECYRQAGRIRAARHEYDRVLQQLALLPADQLLDGVAIGWISDTCRRCLAQLQSVD
jgi:chemotaxis protein methyltransferase CheR